MLKTLSLKESLVLNEAYVELEVCDSCDLTLSNECDCDVFLHIKKAESLTIKCDVKENTNVSILVWNEANANLTFNEDYVVNRDAHLNLAYGDVDASNIERHSMIHLKEVNATSNIRSATLCKTNKQIYLNCASEAPHTKGIIENYCVVLKDGNYKMDAIGKIYKGAYQSQSHQTSRALCFDDKQKAVILPQLLIDENDVEASHATSVGSVDENQLFYMQTRGLSKEDVLRLITIGYLSPIANIIQNETLHNKLLEIIESQVASIC